MRLELSVPEGLPQVDRLLLLLVPFLLPLAHCVIIIIEHFGHRVDLAAPSLFFCTYVCLSFFIHHLFFAHIFEIIRELTDY